MNLVIDKRDSSLRESLIDSGAITSAKITGLEHPRFSPGDVVRLPRLLAQNSRAINYDAWFYHASAEYGMVHIPNLHLNFANMGLDLSFDQKSELSEKFTFPLGISNEALAVVTFAPHLDLSADLTKALQDLSPIRKVFFFLLKFGDLEVLQQRKGLA